MLDSLLDFNRIHFRENARSGVLMKITIYSQLNNHDIRLCELHNFRKYITYCYKEIYGFIFLCKCYCSLVTVR